MTDTIISTLLSPVLRNLNTVRLRSGIGAPFLVSIMRAGGHHRFDSQRYKNLAFGQRKSEPWYDEARDMSRILLLPGILPLMTEIELPAGVTRYPSGTLTTFDIGVADDADIAMLHNGVRLPLSVACRLAVRFGLDDPIELEQYPMMREVWAALATNERGAAPGECVWCLADTAHGGAHLPTCVPGNLWVERSNTPHLVTHAPQPARAGGKRRSGTGWSVRRLRTAARLTQKELGQMTGIHDVYLSKIELGAISLTEDKARDISRALKCRVADLYKREDV